MPCKHGKFPLDTVATGPTYPTHTSDSLTRSHIVELWTLSYPNNSIGDSFDDATHCHEVPVAFTKPSSILEQVASANMCALQHKTVSIFSILDQHHSPVPSSCTLGTSYVYSNFSTLGFSSTDVRMHGLHHLGKGCVNNGRCRTDKVYKIISSPELTQASPSAVCPRRP